MQLVDCLVGHSPETMVHIVPWRPSHKLSMPRSQRASVTVLAFTLNCIAESFTVLTLKCIVLRAAIVFSYSPI